MGADRVARVGAVRNGTPGGDAHASGKRRPVARNAPGAPIRPTERPGAFDRLPRCTLLVVARTTAQRAPSWRPKSLW
jgi:hypothetical protein